MSYEEAQLVEASAALRAAIEQANTGLVGRRSLVELVVLAAVAREHVLVVGSPGTAKSAAVRRVASQLGGRYFEYLLSRFTEPSELFGPVDLRRLREGAIEVQTAGMLPEADVAFLDEVFLGSTAILNNLLSLLNERRFRHGLTDTRVPLRVCVGASNVLPTETSLAAFADRFLLRVFVESIEDASLELLLEQGWSLETPAEAAPSRLAQLDVLCDAVRTVQLERVRPRIADMARMLRNAGIGLSDRRVVKAQRLVAAATVLSGRREASEADLWPVFFAVPSHDDQVLARDVLRDLLSQSESSALAGAAEEASAGPAARAARLAESAKALLAESAHDDAARVRLRVRLEAVAREIDAGFDRARLPEALARERARIVAALQGLTPAPAQAVVTT
jgi:MoxR-like ATPase